MRLPTALVLLAAAGCPSPSVSGALHSDGGALGAWDFLPRSCSNGDTREFYGADLTDGTRAVRVMQDPLRGWTVRVWPTADVTLAPSATLAEGSGCATFTLSLRRDLAYAGKNDSDEDDSAVSGAVQLDCAVEDGGLSGQLAFSECANPGEQVP
jgi:hypothetical protein